MQTLVLRLDFGFVMIYIAEFLVRLLAWGAQKCFSDPWREPESQVDGVISDSEPVAASVLFEGQGFGDTVPGFTMGRDFYAGFPSLFLVGSLRCV